MELPTVANLAGTWAETTPSSSNSSSGAELSTYSFTFTSGGAFTALKTTVTTPVSGLPTTSYGQVRGTYTISGTTVSFTTKESRSPSSPTDDSKDWNTYSGSMVYDVVLSEGKLYGLRGNLYVAQGSTSGLVGTWQQITSDYANLYYKVIQVFGANQEHTISVYSGASYDDATTFVSKSSSSYTATSTAIYDAASSQSHYYKRFGDYLAMGDDASVGAYTRQ